MAARSASGPLRAPYMAERRGAALCRYIDGCLQVRRKRRPPRQLQCKTHQDQRVRPKPRIVIDVMYSFKKAVIFPSSEQWQPEYQMPSTNRQTPAVQLRLERHQRHHHHDQQAAPAPAPAAGAAAAAA